MSFHNLTRGMEALSMEIITFMELRLHKSVLLVYQLTFYWDKSAKGPPITRLLFFALEEGISIRCLPSHTLGSAPVADNPRNICLKYAEEAWQPLPYAFGNGYKNMAFQVDLVFHFDLFSDSHYVESLK